LKLFYSPLSPFARKVQAVLIEKGLADGVEVSTVNPWQEPDDLTVANPISQVPSLVLDDGSALPDSQLICAWLDAHHPQPRLIPEGEGQWAVRKLEATCDAMMENVVKLRQEEMRPEAERSSTHPDRWARTVRRSLDALEAEGGPTGLNLGEISLVCALDYIDFRAGYLNWREGRPNLAARHAALASRPSLATTGPA
jgi:glutathione S-transferase